MQTLLHIALGNAVVAAAMALLLLPAARWLRRPALTHAVSLLILLKLVTPPLVNVPMMWPGPEAAEPAPEIPLPPPPAPPLTSAPEQAIELSQTVAVLVPADPEIATPPAPVTPAAPSLSSRVLRLASSSWAVAAWAGSSALYAAVVLLRIMTLRRAVRRAIVPGEDLSQEVSRLARQMGLAAAPRVRFVSGVAPPMLLALFGKPCVLLPAAFWSRLDDSKRQTLLLHELAHLRRRDHWVRYLELAATCAYWWHPAAWWARSALREAEEQCCDAWVIWAMPSARRTYMTTLLDAVDFISESVRPNSLAAPVLASGMGQFQHLQRRLTMVRERSVQRRLSGGGLVAVVLSAIALPLGPQILRADDAPAAPASRDRQPPAVDQRPAADPDQANADPRANQRPQAAEANLTNLADSADSTGSTRQASSPQSDSRQVPPTKYERSGMSRAESLDAQLKAAQREIEALQQELAATKAASPTRARITAAVPENVIITREQPGVVVAVPLPPSLPDLPAAAKIIIQYSEGKLEAITVPDKKIIWSTEIGRLGSLEPAAGRIIVHDVNGKTLEIAVNDGRIVAERREAGSAAYRVAPFAVGVTPVPVAPQLRGAGTPARTEERLDAIERKLNALIEAVDRRAKSDAERTTQGERARVAPENAAKRQDEKEANEVRSRRESAPPVQATPSDPTDSVAPVTPPRREPTPADGTPPQREPTPALR